MILRGLLVFFLFLSISFCGVFDVSYQCSFNPALKVKGFSFLMVEKRSGFEKTYDMGGMYNECISAKARCNVPKGNLITSSARNLMS